MSSFYTSDRVPHFSSFITVYPVNRYIFYCCTCDLLMKASKKQKVRMDLIYKRNIGTIAMCLCMALSAYIIFHFVGIYFSFIKCISHLVLVKINTYKNFEFWQEKCLQPKVYLIGTNYGSLLEIIINRIRILYYGCELEPCNIGENPIL